MIPLEDVKGLSTMSSAIRGVTNYYDWIYSTLKPFLGLSIMEIGPGYGNMASQIAKDGKKYAGVDSDAGIIQRLNATPHGNGIQFLCGDVTSASKAVEYRQRGIDTILSTNVLEHIQEDSNHVRLAARCAPGGKFVFFVPAIPFLYGSMDREAGHFRRYTKSSMKVVLDKAGVELIHLTYFNFTGALAWFAAAKVLKVKLNSEETNSSISVYDRLVIPLSRGIDPALKWMGGQSLIAVAKIPVTAEHW